MYAQSIDVETRTQGLRGGMNNNESLIIISCLSPKDNPVIFIISTKANKLCSTFQGRLSAMAQMGCEGFVTKNRIRGILWIADERDKVVVRATMKWDIDFQTE
jgi:hypothetical protein